MSQTLTNNLYKNLELLHIEATKVYPEAPILRDLCLAQAILESRLLGVPSKLATMANNLFGIKGKGTAGSVWMLTWEHINGKDIKVEAAFAKNATVEDSIKQHRHVLELPRYKKVWLSKTFDEAAKATHEAGYATDPGYPSKLIDIYNKYIKSI